MTSGSPVQGPASDVIYAAVAARRTQFDSLLWQVPAMGLTAQAFLMTVALLPDSTQVARTIAALLAITMSALSVFLLTKHRQAEIADAHWLADQDARHGVHDAHGPGWAARRMATSADAALFSPLARLRGFLVWAYGLSIFGVAGIAILVITWVAPTSLAR